MSKFYRVVKENFLWDVGAVIEDKHTYSRGNKAYATVDDIFKKHEDEDEEEVISAEIIEASPEYFERVYPVNLLTKTAYKAKEEAKALLAEQFK